MDKRAARHLERILTAQCSRAVKLTERRGGGIGIVLEPTGDRGRVELLALGDVNRWTVSDRGAMKSLYGLDLDFVIAKLAQFDTAIVRRGDEIVTHADDRSLAEAIADLVEVIEFVPVLAGLFANEVAA